jgi:uncharacterized protein YecE (DUF72 family)
MTSQRGTLWLGTQGFAFDDWVGPFYPPGTPQAAYLETYAREFSTVEIDSTFYATPRTSVVEGWARRTPGGFRFSAKFPKLITHDKKLEGARGDGEAFVGTMQVLGEKLGVLTLQFAYDFTPDLFGRLEGFLRDLPKGPRYAVEIRNRRWLTPDLGEMLSGLGVALVLQDLYYMPKMSWITSGFTVIRWLGRRSDIEHFDRIQIDRTKELTAWAERVREFLDDGVEVFGYFNNHFAGHSPASLRQFVQVLDQVSTPASRG